jgi:hypothetical protein
VLIPVFHGKVSDDGERLELAENERNLRRGYLRQLAGQAVDVIVRRHRKRRSDAQNRYHWGIAVPLIAQELGYDKHEHEDVHYALVSKCFGTHLDAKLKQEIPNKRSSMLSTEEFSQLMEWEVRWAATELGIVVPLPNEVL